MPTSRRAHSAAVAAIAVALAAVALGGLSSAGAQAPPGKPPVFADLVPGVAVGGYDPVAYFTEGKPVEGKPDITLVHEGATWRFATTANRDAFQKEPAKYAPQYGGYCAWAVAQGYTAKGDPKQWSIVDGRLYLNYSQSVRTRWESDKAAQIKKGDRNWPTVLTN